MRAVLLNGDYLVCIFYSSFVLASLNLLLIVLTICEVAIFLAYFVEYFIISSECRADGK